MNELIKTTQNESGEIAVNGRDIHEFLGIKDNYTDWIKRMFEYGFEENIDYISLSEKSDKGGRPKINHVLKLDMAKEISMIQRNEKGKQARQYFIEVEKKFKSQQATLPGTYKDALIALVASIEEKERIETEKRQIAEQKAIVEQKLIEQEPVVEYANAIQATKYAIPLADFAKNTKHTTKLGPTKLLSKLREKNILMNSYEFKNIPYQQYVDRKYFEIEQYPFVKDGIKRIGMKIKITPKGQVWLLKQIDKWLIESLDF